MTDKAYAVPLHEQLASVPRNARLVIEDTDGMGTRFIPVGRMCHEAAEALRARLSQCDRCGEVNPAEIHTCTPKHEPAECDGGQCGIGGYCKQCPKTQPEPEPVAWMYNGNLHEFDPSDWAEGEVIPLYTAPPQRECVSCAGLCCQDYEKCNLPCTPRGREQARREWQGLTDEEVFAALVAVDGNTQRLAPGFVAFYCAIEAALKAKNG